MNVTEKTETIEYLVFEFGKWHLKAKQITINKAHHDISTKPFYKLTQGDNTHIYKNRNEYINGWIDKRMKKKTYESDPLAVEVGRAEALIAFKEYIFKGYHEETKPKPT